MVIIKLYLVYHVVVTVVLGQYRPRFHVPYACSVLYDFGSGKDAALIGAGSILDKTIVMVSVDNLNEHIPGSREYFYRHVQKISVHAGSNLMDPRKDPGVKWTQSVKAKTLYVAYRPIFSDPTNVYWTNPSNLSRAYGKVEYDAYGVSFNVGFLEVETFSWSPFVQPIIISAYSVIELARWALNETEFQEKQALPTEICFTYSYNAALNQMRYHEVTYLPKKDCVDVYCMYRLSKCTLFPIQGHHLCYKSTKFIDVCPEARGAALYCENFHRSVIGILTFAPLCGRHNTPGVYTSIPFVAQFYEKLELPPGVKETLIYPDRTNYVLDHIAIQQAFFNT